MHGDPTDNVSVVDLASNTVLTTIPIGSGPNGMAILPDDSQVYVANIYSNDISVIGTANNNVVATLPDGGSGPKYIAIGKVPQVNQPPVVGIISVNTSPVQVNTAITASVSFTDPNVSDTHTATWNWGDGSTTTGTVTESNGSGSVSNTHSYTATGVYTVTLTVTDNHGATGTATYQYVAVYDPSAGFLTGSGKYTSQAGWDTQNTSATGDVTFGVEAKYQSGNTPTGKSKITFKAGNLDFTSTSYSWLVVSGAKATLQGIGTINGSGNYTILISVIDGSQAGGQNLIRVKITDSSNTVIYDTQSGAPDSADPTTVLTNGSIKVH